MILCQHAFQFFCKFIFIVVIIKRYTGDNIFISIQFYNLILQTELFQKIFFPFVFCNQMSALRFDKYLIIKFISCFCPAKKYKVRLESTTRFIKDF